MVQTGVPQIEEQIDDHTDVVILMGINDCVHGENRWELYISYINKKAAEWKEKGARIFYGTLMPVGKQPGDDSYRHLTNQGNITDWNNAMKSGLTEDTVILELYEFVLPEYASHDGLHYDTVTYCRIYNEIIRLLAAS